MNTPIKYPWQQFVVDAFLEFKPEPLPSKIAIAERAISQRLNEGPRDPEEQLALRDAFTALKTLVPPKPLPEASEQVMEARKRA